jgi:NADPH:quinone reductase-like Zn-dependent oxidoreductase
MTFERASSCILTGLRAYSFLFDHCKNLQRGSSVFIQNGATVMQIYSLQLALSLNFHVWTTVNTDMEYNALADFNVDSSDSTTSLRIIDTRVVDNILQHLMQETGGLGVDAVLLDGSDNNLERGTSLETFISILGLNGTLIIPQSPFTTSEEEQNASVLSHLNMAMYKTLFLKNGRIGTLFEQSYILSCAQQGKYLHMLTEILNNVNNDKIDIKVSYTYPIEKVREAHRKLEQSSTLSSGKIVLKL